MGISVIIPLYNKEKHIKRAINSVLKQTYDEFEIIIINDGSSDNSLSIVKELNDSRIQVYSQKNQGVSAARNRGVECSKYDLIAFLDADDTWKPHFLEELNSLRALYPNAGIYGTSFEIKSENGKMETAKNHFVPQGWTGIVDDYFKVAINNQILWTSALGVTRNAFEKVGGFTVGMTRGEDLEVWIKIASEFQVAFSNRISAVYHRDSENMASKKTGDYETSLVKSVEELYISLSNKKYASKYFKEYMIRLFITKAKYLIEIGRKEEARTLLMKYKDTKFFKRRWFATYSLSYIPQPLYYLLISSEVIKKLVV